MGAETKMGGLARWMLAALACGSFAVAACSAPVEEEADSAADAITDVHPTPVKEQVIGNCWLYSVTSLAESLHKAATDEELNLSESYLTYWYWFEQLTKPGQCGVSAITEGGTWELARGLVSRYGMMREGDFIPADAKEDASGRQAPALEALNAALADSSSPLQKAVASGDRRAIRDELDRIWHLSPEVSADLDRVFGADGARTLDRAKAAAPAGSKVIPASAFAVRIPDRSGALHVGTLAEVVDGDAAWTDVTAPGWTGDDSPEDRRAYQRRVQRALHDGLPVLVSWWVDFESLDKRGNFRPRTSKVPAEGGGGHMSIITDYEVTNVPGFGTLKAGKVETRQAALEAALDEDAKISFFRIKNSWGYWPSTWKETILRTVDGVDLGYNDLHTAYLFRPMTVRVDASMVADSAESSGDPCQGSAPTGETVVGDLFPLIGVVLPPGY